MKPFIELSSFVRGVHAYKDLWKPRIGEVLQLQREPNNSQDKLAVAVLKSGRVVGHVLKNLAPIFSPFLSAVVIKLTRYNVDSNNYKCQLG